MKKAVIIYARFHKKNVKTQKSPCVRFSLFGTIVELVKFWLRNGTGLNDFDRMEIDIERKDDE